MMPYNKDEEEFLKSKKILRKEIKLMSQLTMKNKVTALIYGVAIGLTILIFASVASAKALTGWSGGYRYYYDGDDKYKSKLRLFGKYKDIRGHIVKFGWERQTGVIPNFTRTGTYDGHKLDDFGVMFIEQEFKF